MYYIFELIYMRGDPMSKFFRKRVRSFRIGMVTAEVLEGVLFWLGFRLDRISGSHFIYRHADGRIAVVPWHKGKTVKKGLFFGLLRRINITKQEFKHAFLKRKEVLAFLFYALMR